LPEKHAGGRPTTNPRPHKLSVRVSDKTLQTLDEYCERKKVSRADGVRKGIDGLQEQK